VQDIDAILPASVHPVFDPEQTHPFDNYEIAELKKGCLSALYKCCG
jgi:hypothetical protein